jgi:hypothetical protein
LTRRRAALGAGQADISRTRSASFPTRVKDVLARAALTNLYNERPAWLDHAHHALDEAVAEAYGWKPDMPDDEVLAKLLALNLTRAGAER